MRGGFDPPHLYSMQQRGGRVPPAPVSGRGHPSRWFRGQRGGVHPLCACFRVQRGGWTPLSPFSTRHGEGRPLLTIFDTTRGADALSIGIEDNGKGVSSPPIFEANGEDMTSPTIFNAAWTTPPAFFCLFPYIFHTKSVINKYTMKNIIIIIVFYMKYNT